MLVVAKCGTVYEDGSLWDESDVNVTIISRRKNSCTYYFDCDKTNDCKNQQGLQMYLSGKFMMIR